MHARGDKLPSSIGWKSRSKTDERLFRERRKRPRKWETVVENRKMPGRKSTPLGGGG